MRKVRLTAMTSSGVTSRPTPRPRVGRSGFLTCAPLYWGLARSTALLDIDLVQDTPDRLTGRLLSGDVDVSAISSVEYLRYSSDLVVLPGIAVGSDGPIQTSVIVTKVPLGDLDGRTVALATTSPTSAQISRLLLEKHYGIAPRYVTQPPDLDAMLTSADAAVLTGDAALAATLSRPAHPGVHVYDLGELWKRWTGLPLVLAVWAVRREAAEQRPDIVELVHRSLLAARDLARRESAELAGRLAAWEPFSSGKLEDFFTRVLDFSLGQRQWLGLREFARHSGNGNLALAAPGAVTAPS
ncbi:menaquinone biosynthesis protein [Streptomyces sp. NK08204]|uniref:menaquinone biosynthetic enzyme MqnA/MqnD family protein n=1 Tax=Streptomyces sp. NK08204 TaxID=2873260 RepID=UPI0027E2B715|nr:menaquinone biosynthesis protein [Streptomyces sp. NK08204]